MRNPGSGNVGRSGIDRAASITPPKDRVDIVSEQTSNIAEGPIRTASDSEPHGSLAVTISSEQLQSDIRAKIRIIEELRKENESLLTEGTRLGKRLGAIEEKQRDRIRESETLARDKRDLESKLAASEAKLAKLDGLHDELKRIKAELGTETAKRSKAENELIRNSAAAVARKRADEFEASLVRLQEERTNLIQSNRQLEKEVDRVRKETAGQIASLESYVGQLRVELTQMEAMSQPAESSAFAIAPLVDMTHFPTDEPGRIQELLAENDSLRAQLGLVEASEADTGRILAELKAKVTRIEGSLAKSISDVAHRDTEIARLLEKVSALEALRRGLGEALETQASSQERLLAEESARHRSECERLNTELALLRSRVPDTNSVSTTSSHDALLSHKFEMALQAIGKLQDELDDAREREADARRQIAILTQQVSQR